MTTLFAYDSLEGAALLNDFEALAYTLCDVTDADSVLLQGPRSSGKGPIVVVRPGTGLGAAVCLPTSTGVRVLTTEAGQMNFAPCNAREREVLTQLASSAGYVSYERVLSGPSLPTLYPTLRKLRGRVPVLHTLSAVTAAVQMGHDVDATEALEIFCAALGTFVGNFAVAFMASGGIYLAGGILSQIASILGSSLFLIIPYTSDADRVPPPAVAPVPWHQTTRMILRDRHRREHGANVRARSFLWLRYSDNQEPLCRALP